MSQEVEPAQLQALIDRHKNADPPELEKVRAEIEKLGEPVLIPLLKAYREAQERGEKALAKELDWTIFTSLQIPFKQLTTHIYEAKKKAGWWKDEELVRVMTYTQGKETVEMATSLAKKAEEEADADISTLPQNLQDIQSNILLLYEQDENIRKPAREALVRSGAEAVLPLFKAFRKEYDNDNFEMSRRFDAVLQEIGEPTKQLLAKMEKIVAGGGTWWEDEEKLALVTALMGRGIVESSMNIRRMEEEQKEAEIIRDLPEDLEDVTELVEALYFGDENVRELVRPLVIEMGEPAARQMLKRLNLALIYGTGCGVGFDEIKPVFNEIGEPAFQLLLRALKSKKAANIAAIALGILEDRRAFEPLLEAFGKADLQVKAQIARSLGTMKDQRALPYLIQAFQTANSDQYFLLEAIAIALLELDTYDPVLAGLKSVNKNIFNAALSAIGQVGDKRALATLKTLNKTDANLNNLIDNIIQKIEAQNVG